MSGVSQKKKISVCVNLTCYDQGAEEIINFVEGLDGSWEVEPIRCFGHCGYGPCVEINGVLSEGVTIENLYSLLENANKQNGS